MCTTYNKLNEVLYDFKMKFKYIFNVLKKKFNVEKRLFLKLRLFKPTFLAYFIMLGPFNWHVFIWVEHANNSFKNNRSIWTKHAILYICLFVGINEIHELMKTNCVQYYVDIIGMN